MSKSSRIRSRELRFIHTLVGECRELGADAFLWRRHLYEGLDRLIGDCVRIGGEFYGSISEPASLTPSKPIDLGWDSPSSRRIFYGYFNRSDQPNCDELIVALFRQFHPPLSTYARRDVLSDKDWYSSETFNGYRRQGFLDDSINSFALMRGGFDAITLHRRLHDRPWTPRDVMLVKTVHSLLRPMIGYELASVAEHDPVPLTPRKQQTLDLLLEGLAEQEIARELDLSQNTVHQYVRMLYKRYRVTSRAQLLALWIRRHRRRAGDRDLHEEN